MASTAGLVLGHYFMKYVEKSTDHAKTAVVIVMLMEWFGSMIDSCFNQEMSKVSCHEFYILFA